MGADTNCDPLGVMLLPWQRRGKSDELPLLLTKAEVVSFPKKWLSVSLNGLRPKYSNELRHSSVPILVNLWKIANYDIKVLIGLPNRDKNKCLKVFPD